MIARALFAPTGDPIWYARIHGTNRTNRAPRATTTHPTQPTDSRRSASAAPANVSLDPDTVVRIVEEHEAGLWRYLRFLGCEPARAEDLAQETFVKFLEKPFEERSRGETASYLRSIARNLFLASTRKTSRVLILDDLGLADAVWVEEGRDEDDGEDRLRALQACLDRVRGRSREALELRYRRRRSMADIAGDLSISEANVRVILHRARQALRRCLEKKLTS